jgi:hypothetical protein
MSLMSLLIQQTLLWSSGMSVCWSDKFGDPSKLRFLFATCSWRSDPTNGQADATCKTKWPSPQGHAETTPELTEWDGHKFCIQSLHCRSSISHQVWAGSASLADERCLSRYRRVVVPCYQRTYKRAGVCTCEAAQRWRNLSGSSL